MAQQTYDTIPTHIDDVRGTSSQTIFLFMKGCLPRNNTERYPFHPFNANDWERNKALLLCYPEWKERLPEMSCISKQWELIVQHWDRIEEKYNNEYSTQGCLSFEGPCNKYIRELVPELEF